jgi:hypothetical protein
MAARIAEVGDLWSDMPARGFSLRRPMAALRKHLGPRDGRSARPSPSA